MLKNESAFTYICKAISSGEVDRCKFGLKKADFCHILGPKKGAKKFKIKTISYLEKTYNGYYVKLNRKFDIQVKQKK